MKYKEYEFDSMRSEDFSFIYITSPGCSVCKVLAPKLEEMSKEFPRATFHRIDLEENPLAKSKFMAFAIPTLIVYSLGQEMIRGSRHMDLGEINQKLTRYYELIFS